MMQTKKAYLGKKICRFLVISNNHNIYYENNIISFSSPIEKTHQHFILTKREINMLNTFILLILQHKKQYKVDWSSINDPRQERNGTTVFGNLS